MMRDEQTDVLLKSLDAAGPRRPVTERSRQDLERILAADAPVADLRPAPDRRRAKPPRENVPGTNLSGTNQPGTNQPGTGVPGINVPGTNLSGTSVSGRNLPASNVPDRNVPGMNMPRINLTGTNVPRINLTGTNVPGRNLPARKRRLILVGAAVAVALGIIAVPAVVGGDPAFATWTQTPSPLSAEASERAGEDCRSRNTVEESSSADVAIAERRGEWNTVVLSGPGSFSAMCVTDGSLFGGSFGYSGQRPGGSDPAPRELLPTAMGMGSASAGELSMVVGAAGSEVSGVSFQSRSDGEVRASVANGYFVLWFPGDELRDYPKEGVLLRVSYTDGTQAQVRASLDWANS